MAKDIQGTLRGACTYCDCGNFHSNDRIRCDYCDHPAAKHQNLSLLSLKPHDDDDDSNDSEPTDGDSDEGSYYHGAYIKNATSCTRASALVFGLLWSRIVCSMHGCLFCPIVIVFNRVYT